MQKSGLKTRILRSQVEIYGQKSRSQDRIFDTLPLPLQARTTLLIAAAS